MDIHHLPAYELADKIKNKEISSLELTQHFIDRIEKYDGKINAVVVRTFEDALEAAKKADDTISKKDSLGPLHGIPMTRSSVCHVVDPKNLSSKLYHLLF